MKIAKISICWLGEFDTPRWSPKQLGVEEDEFHYFKEPEAWLEKLTKAKNTSIAIISLEASPALELTQNLKAMNIDTFWVCEDVSVTQCKEFYSLGGVELLTGDISEFEFAAKIANHKKHKLEISSLKAQLEESSSMALLAMDSSSDMGSILGFVKEALNEHEYQQLADSIFKFVHAFSRAALIEIVGATNCFYYCTEGKVSRELKLLLSNNKSRQRVIRHKDLLQINRDNFTILVVGLPEDNPERIGRISDNMAIFADIADRFIVSLALEEQLNSAETAKQAFLDTLGHELKTPLNAIVGFSKLMHKKQEDDTLGPNGVKAIDNIYSSSQRITNMISTLMDISHVSGNQRDLVPQEIRMSAVVESVIDTLTTKIQKSANRVDIDVPEDLMLLSDPLQVEKMILQLVDNAVKFTKEGVISIKVKSREGSPFNWVDIIVHDNGCGIDRALQEKLFSSVGQLDQSHDRHHYGLGIGLYYVGVMSEFLGGKIDLISQVKVGSTFTLSLPSLTHENNDAPSIEADGDCELF